MLGKGSLINGSLLGKLNHIRGITEKTKFDNVIKRKHLCMQEQQVGHDNILEKQTNPM